MGSRQVDNCERVLPGPACLEGMHEECGHWHGSRGAFNYRRLRREGFTILCRCDCHSSCPVTNGKSTVGDQAWRQSCTCPGAEAMRRMLDEFGTLPFGIRDFREMWAGSRNELQSRREAFKAAQASAAGKDREQLKDLYVAELRARGLKIPDDEVLDAAIEAHMREAGNFGKLLGSLRHPR
jgi:hypothetical protein